MGERNAYIASRDRRGMCELTPLRECLPHVPLDIVEMVGLFARNCRPLTLVHLDPHPDMWLPYVPSDWIQPLARQFFSATLKQLVNAFEHAVVRRDIRAAKAIRPQLGVINPTRVQQWLTQLHAPNKRYYPSPKTLQLIRWLAQTFNCPSTHIFTKLSVKILRDKWDEHFCHKKNGKRAESKHFTIDNLRMIEFINKHNAKLYDCVVCDRDVKYYRPRQSLDEVYFHTCRHGEDWVWRKEIHRRRAGQRPM